MAFARLRGEMTANPARTTSADSYYRDRSVCITGGAGFIGGHLAERLIGLGARVTIIDDLSTGDLGLTARLVEGDPDRVRFLYASILDGQALREALSGAEVVFHQAAMGSVPRSIEEPVRCLEVNATGTLRVLEEARWAGAKRVVFASSSSVYGGGGDLERGSSEDDLRRARSPYAASKCSAEHLVESWASCYELDAVSLRYFNVFGARQSAASDYAAVVPAFIKAIGEVGRARIFGDGSFTRDFTPVGNVVDANLLAGAHSERLGGMAINVGCGRRTSILELAETIGRVMGKAGVESVHEAERAGDVAHSLADLERARRVLGYEPAEDLESGLLGLIESMRSDTDDDSDRPGVIYRFGS